jgi:uncharacterized protein (TIGR03435 family)
VRALAYLGFVALFASPVFAQTEDASPKFGIAEIHPSPPNTILEMRSRFSRGRYELRNASLVDLIRTAWSVDADKVVGGPDWLDTNRFDVIAMAPADSTPEALHTMLRNLLADRFHLVARKDTRSLPAYVMTAGKKLQLRLAGPSNESSEEAACKTSQPARMIVFECRNMTMAAFANQLPGVREASGYLFNYPVVDRTGLKDAFNYTVQWSPRIALRPSPLAADAVTIFDAIEKLGLKLELSKIPTPVVVVQSVNEKPTANSLEVTEKPPAPLTFEVASIKPDEPNNPNCSSISIQPGGRVRINMTLKWLIVEAWGALIPPNRIVDGPKSMDSPCFTIVARAPFEEEALAGSDAAGWNGPVWNGVDIDSMRMMLRALLVDRFKLEAHQEDRLMSGYDLVAASPKLRKADPSTRPGCKEGPGADGKDPRITNPLVPRLITCRSMTLAQFAAELGKLFPELPPVVDSTGIAGRYDMTINFSPSRVLASIGVPAAGGDAAASEPNGAISFTEALSRQLGLKLQSRKVMAPVLVIDHVNETPTEN